MQNIVEQTQPEGGMVSRDSELKVGNSIADEANGVNKTEPIRVKLSDLSGLVQGETDHKMIQQQSIHLLEHPLRFERTHRTCGVALEVVDYIDRVFNFPEF